MDKKPVDVAVIGLGLATKPHMDALKLLQDQIRVSGVLNRSRERAEEVATQSGNAVLDRD